MILNLIDRNLEVRINIHTFQIYAFSYKSMTKETTIINSSSLLNKSTKIRTHIKTKRSKSLRSLLDNIILKKLRVLKKVNLQQFMKIWIIESPFFLIFD